MGRELRRVPASWQHPRNDHGEFQPLYDEDFQSAARAWMDNAIKWDRGEHPDQIDNPELRTEYPYFWQWADVPPDPEYYRPAWTDEVATHYQIYETVSEGTPISPVFASRDEVAAWLVGQGYSQHAAEAFAKDGYAPSMIMAGGRIFPDIHSFDAP